MTTRTAVARRTPRDVFGALPLLVLLVVHPAPVPGLPAYAPALYGPDVPLGEVVQELGIALVEGQWLPEAAITVVKSERKLLLHAGDLQLKVYRIQLGRAPEGPKRTVGDSRTPEGEYVICRHNPNSRYHLSLQINYPNAADIARGLASGVLAPEDAGRLARIVERGGSPPAGTPLGGDVFIHGQHPEATEQIARWTLKTSLRKDLQPGDIDPATLKRCHDWTLGCVALTNPDIRELYRFVPDGTPVTIRP
jgi:murein L,D-transpeptidase YafK